MTIADLKRFLEKNQIEDTREIMIRIDVVGNKVIMLSTNADVLMTNNSSRREIVLSGYIDETNEKGAISKWI